MQRPATLGQPALAGTPCVVKLPGRCFPAPVPAPIGRRLVCRVAATDEPEQDEQQPALVQKPSLRPPPPRPAKEITRAPPSPRTRMAKERQMDGQPQRPRQNNGFNRGPPGASTSAPGRGGPGRGAPAGGPPAAAPGAQPNAGRGGPGRGAPGRGVGRGKAGGRGRGRGSDDDFGPRGRGRGKPQGNLTAKNRRASRATRKKERQEAREAGKSVREEILEIGPEGMAVGDLAESLAVNSSEVVKLLFLKGVMVQVNQVLDPDAVKLVCAEYEVEVLDREEGGVTQGARKTHDFDLEDDDIDFLQQRPPVVTVMGHVDHGKTSLLDFIRNTKVAAGEAGGITQTIGAYTCEVAAADGSQRQVTFLDTPGHEAFSAMRARGARVTDIAIIICAADDGVQPQTIEAIGHAKAAGVPIIAAINKVDKDGANVERTKQLLSEAGLFPEEWGGDTPMVQISAKKGTGIDELLETVLLVAEVEELVANPEKPAAGTVIEAHLDKQVGPVATLLVQAGTLRVGDTVCVGCSYGRVRTLRDNVTEVREAGPSIAVQMVGLNAVPDAGDTFKVFEDESEARQAAELATQDQRLARLAEQAGGGSVVTLSSLATMDDDVEALQRLNIILKGDASGSVEAVKGSLLSLPQDSVMLRFLLASPGDISTSDLDLAQASQGLVLGFNLSPSEALLADAKRKGVEMRTYDVIYDLIDDVRSMMEGRLKSVEERVYLGTANVKAVFGEGKRAVAGCAVEDGVLKKGATVQVTRGKRTVFDGGLLTSLRRVKDDVKEVSAGTECGCACEGFTDWREGDVIKVFDLVEQRRTLEDASATTVLEMTPR